MSLSPALRRYGCYVDLYFYFISRPLTGMPVTVSSVRMTLFSHSIESFWRYCCRCLYRFGRNLFSAQTTAKRSSPVAPFCLLDRETPICTDYNTTHVTIRAPASGPRRSGPSGLRSCELAIIECQLMNGSRRRYGTYCDRNLLRSEKFPPGKFYVQRISLIEKKKFDALQCKPEVPKTGNFL